MGVTIRQNTLRLADLRLVDSVLMREVGQLLVRRIRTRTEQGQDSRGQAFAALSPGYVKARAKAGIGIGSRSRLTLSGQMLNDMQVTSTTDRTVTISFVTGDNRPASGGTMIQRSRETGANAKANWAMGEGRVERHFFDLSEADEQDAQDRIGAYLDRITGA